MNLGIGFVGMRVRAKKLLERSGYDGFQSNQNLSKLG
jgi:hypothetical protein